MLSHSGQRVASVSRAPTPSTPHPFVLVRRRPGLSLPVFCPPALRFHLRTEVRREISFCSAGLQPGIFRFLWHSRSWLCSPLDTRPLPRLRPSRTKPYPSFRTQQADFFFRFRSCESVGLRREKSLFASGPARLHRPLAISLVSRYYLDTRTSASRIRIISARKATRKEVGFYEEGI